MGKRNCVQVYLRRSISLAADTDIGCGNRLHLQSQRSRGRGDGCAIIGADGPGEPPVARRRVRRKRGGQRRRTARPWLRNNEGRTTLDTVERRWILDRKQTKEISLSLSIYLSIYLSLSISLSPHPPTPPHPTPLSLLDADGLMVKER
jgi:hypothetical protein